MLVETDEYVDTCEFMRNIVEFLKRLQQRFAVIIYSKKSEAYIAQVRSHGLKMGYFDENLPFFASDSRIRSLPCVLSANHNVFNLTTILDISDSGWHPSYSETLHSY
jgi:hypothetical protein